MLVLSTRRTVLQTAPVEPTPRQRTAFPGLESRVVSH